jgi:toxin secretion/phage lysis holin
MESANNIMLTIKLTGAAITAFLVRMLGGWDMALKVLVAMTVLDYITGILAALYLKELSSNISYRGIIKKFGIYVIVTVAFLLDQNMNTGTTLRGLAIGFYTATEGISLVENWGRMDLPLPDMVKKTLAQLKQNSDSGGANDEQA